MFSNTLATTPLIESWRSLVFSKHLAGCYSMSLLGVGISWSLTKHSPFQPQKLNTSHVSVYYTIFFIEQYRFSVAHLFNIFSPFSWQKISVKNPETVDSTPDDRGWSNLDEFIGTPRKKTWETYNEIIHHKYTSIYMCIQYTHLYLHMCIYQIISYYPKTQIIFAPKTPNLTEFKVAKSPPSKKRFEKQTMTSKKTSFCNQTLSPQKRRDKPNNDFFKIHLQ